MSIERSVMSTKLSLKMKIGLLEAFELYEGQKTLFVVNSIGYNQGKSLILKAFNSPVLLNISALHVIHLGYVKPVWKYESVINDKSNINS